MNLQTCPFRIAIMHLYVIQVISVISTCKLYLSYILISSYNILVWLQSLHQKKNPKKQMSASLIRDIVNLCTISRGVQVNLEVITY